MSCKFFSISTYDYIRNTCLHYINELELVLYALGYNCVMMNIIQQVTDPMPTNFSLLFLLSYCYYHHCYTCYKITAITVTVTVVVTTIKTIKLLCY